MTTHNLTDDKGGKFKLTIQDKEQINLEVSSEIIAARFISRLKNYKFIENVEYEVEITDQNKQAEKYDIRISNNSSHAIDALQFTHSIDEETYGILKKELQEIKNETKPGKTWNNKKSPNFFNRRNSVPNNNSIKHSSGSKSFVLNNTDVSSLVKV